MKVVRISDGSLQPANRPIFLGDVQSQPLIDDVSEHVRLTVVRFAPGARTRLHAHEFEQVLLVTEGEGVFSTEGEQFSAGAGAVVVIPPGEPHIHAATDHSHMTHISITTPGETRLLE